MLDTVRRLRRSFRVARTGLRIYLGYKRTQRAVRRLDAPAAEAAWNERHEQFAEELYRLAVDLKGLYIKAGQFISTRSDLVPPAYTRSLARLQDRVPPHPAAEARATIERELGRPVGELFAELDVRPVAAASLAQVHRATLFDGRRVAVKVQYPDAEALVRLDVHNLRMLVALVARLEPNFDYRAVAQEIASQVPLELDFAREARMAARIGRNLASVPGVVVPQAIDGLVSRRVLVSEWLDGQRLLDHGHPGEAALSGGHVVVERIAAAFGQQILVDGLFQADPHPGNILILDDGAVGLLDFGLTKELPDEARLGFARLVLAAAKRDAPAILAAFDALGLRTRSQRPEDLFALMRGFFEPRSVVVGAGLSRDSASALSRNPVDVLPPDLVLLGRVVGLLRGVSASLGVPLSPMEMLRPYAERVLAEAAGSSG